MQIVLPLCGVTEGRVDLEKTNILCAAVSCHKCAGIPPQACRILDFSATSCCLCSHTAKLWHSVLLAPLRPHFQTGSELKLSSQSVQPSIMVFYCGVENWIESLQGGGWGGMHWNTITKPITNIMWNDIFKEIGKVVEDYPNHIYFYGIWLLCVYVVRITVLQK